MATRFILKILKINLQTRDYLVAFDGIKGSLQNDLEI